MHFKLKLFLAGKLRTLATKLDGKKTAVFAKDTGKVTVVSEPGKMVITAYSKDYKAVRFVSGGGGGGGYSSMTIGGGGGSVGRSTTFVARGSNGNNGG